MPSSRASLSPAAPTVIITADDLGLDCPTNEAIIDAMVAGWTTHASLIVNLGFAEEACALARGHGLDGRIGIHLNLSEGKPLTPALTACAGFCADGRFRPVEEFPRYSRLNAEEKTVVAAEIRAQIAAATALGITVSHVDSHNDVHIEPSLAHIVAEIARQSGIARVRISRNCGERQGILRRWQHHAYNRWLARHGLRAVVYFGTIDDIMWLGRRGHLDTSTSVEILTHPRKGPDLEVIDVPSMEPLAQRLSRLVPYLPHIAAVSAGDGEERR